MKICLTKDATGLHGFTPHDRDVIDGLQNGFYKANITRPRDQIKHRRFFSMVRYAFSLQEEYTDIDEFLAYIKVMVGHCNVLQLDGDILCRVPKSINFAMCDDAEFNVLYSRVVDFFIERYCPGETTDEIDRQAMVYVRYT